MTGFSRALLAVLFLGAAGIAAADAADQEPRPPCGGLAPLPAYSAPGQEPNVQIWTGAQLGGAWTPPACTGWSAKSDGVLVAVAGKFSFQAGAEELLARFGAISALAGLQYWSVSEGGWRTLITAAAALEEPDATKKRRDFTSAEMKQGGDLYFRQSDNRSSDEILYRMQIREFGPDGFVVAVENVSQVKRNFVTLFNPGDLRSVHFIAREKAGEWAYYGMAFAGESLASRLAVPQASYLNRALALYRHFTGQEAR